MRDREALAKIVNEAYLLMQSDGYRENSHWLGPFMHHITDWAGEALYGPDGHGWTDKASLPHYRLAFSAIRPQSWGRAAGRTSRKD